MEEGNEAFGYPPICIYIIHSCYSLTQGNEWTHLSHFKRKNSNFQDSFRFAGNVEGYLWKICFSLGFQYSLNQAD